METNASTTGYQPIFEISRTNPHAKVLERLYKLDRAYSDLIAKHELYWDNRDPDDRYEEWADAVILKQDDAAEAILYRIERLWGSYWYDHKSPTDLPSSQIEIFEKEYVKTHGYPSYAMDRLNSSERGW